MKQPTMSLESLLSGTSRSDLILLEQLALDLSKLEPGSVPYMKLLGDTEVSVRQAMICDGWPIEVAIYSSLVLTDALMFYAGILKRAGLGR